MSRNTASNPTVEGTSPTILPAQELYIDIQPDPTDPDFNHRIEFFDDEYGQQPRRSGGDVTVPAGGSRIVFRPIQSPSSSFDFHDLVLHPLGAAAAKLDLKWIVFSDLMVVHDLGRFARQFNYCISVSTMIDGLPAKIYFDPQMVNVGGDPPK